MKPCSDWSMFFTIFIKLKCLSLRKNYNSKGVSYWTINENEAEYLTLRYAFGFSQHISLKEPCHTLVASSPIVKRDGWMDGEKENWWGLPSLIGLSTCQQSFCFFFPLSSSNSLVLQLHHYSPPPLFSYLHLVFFFPIYFLFSDCPFYPFLLPLTFLFHILPPLNYFPILKSL